jgi:uncharacterized membrane protein
MSDVVEVRTSVAIARPRDRVWAVLVDVGRQPEWMRDALSVGMLTAGPLGVGSRMRVPTQIGFLRTVDLMEVSEFDPPERWTVVHRGVVTGEGSFTLVDLDGKSTRVEWRERLAPPLGAIGRVGMTLFRPLLRRQFQSDLERLRGLCES